MKDEINEIEKKNTNIYNDKSSTNNIIESKPPQRKSKIHQKLGLNGNNQNSNNNAFNQNSEKEKNNLDNEDDEQLSLVNYDLGKNIYRYNLILVGDISVGKTSIINRFIENRFNRNVKNTINIEFRIKSLKLDPNTVIDLKIWDTCGEEKFHSITKNFYHDADGIFIIFDLGNSQSFYNIKIFLKDINDICNINNKSIMIIGNKNDLPLEDIKVKEKDVEKILGKNKEFKYLDVSARSVNNINDMFIQMSKLIFINKNKIIENENEESSSENNFKIGRVSKKDSKKSLKSLDEERKER